MIRKTSIEGLKEHARQKNKETFQKVDEAIKKLKRSKSKPINFQSVAEESGISRPTLYNNPKIKERIISLREFGRYDAEALDYGRSRDKLEEKDGLNKNLRNAITKLKNENRMLKIQLIEMEDLKIQMELLKNRTASTAEVVDLKNIQNNGARAKETYAELKAIIKNLEDSILEARRKESWFMEKLEEKNLEIEILQKNQKLN
jgi:uncharacterized protein DUF6262